ncbi:hypothetical protein N0V90_001550 [Kalmusia sp. IMI 367209]|nr:hypothetical protein N0V90_001550 [Kalmusia sp. IMI 367209]
MATKLLYPTSLAIDASLLEGYNVSLHAYDVKEPIPEDLLDAEILITWTNPVPQLKEEAKRLTKLRWIQSLAAGPNDVLSAGFDASKITICTARRFFEMRDSQLQGKWPGHLGGPQPDRPKGKFTSLQDANVLVWGFGNIAKTLTPWLTALGANVSGLARSAGVRNGVEVYAEDKLQELLPKTDALVMILPGSDATKHVLNAERLKLLPKHAWVVNVGRGTSIDEAALADALDKGEIGGPHAAGGRPQNPETLIAYNLRKFLAGQELKNII